MDKPLFNRLKVGFAPSFYAAGAFVSSTMLLTDNWLIFGLWLSFVVYVFLSDSALVYIFKSRRKIAITLSVLSLGTITLPFVLITFSTNPLFQLTGELLLVCGTLALFTCVRRVYNVNRLEQLGMNENK